MRAHDAVIRPAVGLAVGALLLVVGDPSGLAEQTILSGFEGSTELGSHRAEFDRLAYARSLEREAPVETVEVRCSAACSRSRRAGATSRCSAPTSAN
jgi:hypothetical protein